MSMHSRSVVMLICLLICGMCAYGSPIPLRCAIVGSDANLSPISVEVISNKITEVNRIFRQVAMSFEITYCICTNDITLTEVSKSNVWQSSRLYGEGGRVLLRVPEEFFHSLRGGR